MQNARNKLCMKEMMSVSFPKYPMEIFNGVRNITITMSA